MARHRCLWACVVGALVIAATASQIQVNHDQAISHKNPHEHATLPFKAVKPRMVGAPFATVTTDVVNATARYVTVNVTWTNVDFTGKSDYLALYTEGMNIGNNAAIEFKYTSPAGKYAPENGSLLFTVINRRASYYFVYVGGAAQYPEEKGRSALFTPFNIYEPLQGHLALVPGFSNAIQVMWNQYQVGNPVVKIGTSPGVYTQTVTATSNTYSQSDLCDPDMSPAATIGWIAPGYFLTAQVFNLAPNQVYYYIFGDSSNNSFSTESSFKAPPAPGTPTDGLVRIFAFGDMGQAPIDGGWQHSWDFNDRGEYPALNTTALIGSVAEPGDAILHIGDISYAVGYLSEWDQFMTQIEPVATKNIWQTGIGNHEEGWTGSYFGPPADSGGECGVAYNIRFPFFQNSSTPNVTAKNAWLPWYSFNYGPVHVIVTSTEHNFTAGSPQHAFVVQDFATINKTATPWTIFTAHRPMYPDSTYSGDIQVSAMLQTAFEDLLVANNVSLGLYGHQHAYSRTCPVINGTCVERGPIHMVIGMAGYSLTKNPATPTPSYIAFNADDFYGVIRITVVDDHKAWVDTYATNGTVVDSFELLQ